MDQKNNGNGIKLEEILDKKHGLYQLANWLNWDYLVESYDAYYTEAGRLSISIRVMAGLHYLKYLENERVLNRIISYNFERIEDPSDRYLA